MSKTPISRNRRVQRYTHLLLRATESGEPGREEIPEEVKADLEAVFSSSAMSFREVLFTAALARIIDPDFQSSVNFYSCNPRPVFEQGIKPILEALGVPSTQSGPLNVMKGQTALNADWANKRTPRHVGLACMRIAVYLDQLEPQCVILLAKRMAWHFNQSKSLVQYLRASSSPDSNGTQIFGRISRLISEAPDFGNTPQRIVGMLLEISFAMTGSNIQIEGLEDRASTTNRTSKKLGDLSIISASGAVLNVYEVTVKEFGQQRIGEASKSLLATSKMLGVEVAKIIVLCRPENVPNFVDTAPVDPGWLGSFTDEFGLTYEFVDLEAWIGQKLVELDIVSRETFQSKIEEYINRTSTALLVKQKWKEILES